MPKWSHRVRRKRRSRGGFRERIFLQRRTKKIEKGQQAEERVFRILRDFTEKKVIFSRKRVIKEVRWSLPFSKEDLDGKDFVIRFNRGKDLALQVKTWYDEKVEEGYKSQGRCFIAVDPDDSDEVIWKQAFDAISNFLLNSAKKNHNKL